VDSYRSSEKARNLLDEGAVAVDVDGKEIEKTAVLAESDLHMQRRGDSGWMRAGPAGGTIPSQRFGIGSMIPVPRIGGARTDLTN
jgi:hypothetical protein